METLVIDKTEILPGANSQVRIAVSRLPSGTKIHIYAHVYRSLYPGPAILVMGGVHGDEINGIEAVRRLIDHKHCESLLRGTVIVIPLLNVYGFINFSRDVPDGKDVNRNFPGSSRGSLASRVAYTLTKKVLPHVDFAIDMHSGGASKYNYPQVRYSRDDERALELAFAFGAPCVVLKPKISKSFRKIAVERKIPVLVYEAGESERLDGFGIETGVQGTLRVLRALNMMEEAPATEHKVRHITKAGWLRAPRSGIFIWSTCSGSFVQKGEVLGTISSPQGNRSIEIKAKKDGFIIGHNNASVVHSGDALFHLGYDQ